jgi:HSP20 family protein
MRAPPDRRHGGDQKSESERSYGRFERTIPFPTEIDAERVEASCENGVLKIVLPKNLKAQAKSHRIQIKGEGKPAAGRPGQGPGLERS